ncbi:nucleotidyltransferase domain-containing protein [uncultured Adlercreutzia sp.]|uniref:nucleotidyltransferase domain-containing protein n=1 Tax=uncultured Adlercreutzia sp. TaxID=875803 RepID=UPI002675527A|nr:nucleotidyltransferase domain-containing protein [uncultured Adlercreutzia sp.]
MDAYGLREEVTAFIVEQARECGIAKVILFGSRASGRFSKKSDIDLAIYGSSFDRYIELLEESCPTLLTFDFIDLSQEVSEGLRERIAQEGVVLYEACEL